MQQFCPLCSKRGFRRKIKALQINFNEALWTCEGEECEWPFGYEDFIYVSRKVGNTWSCYWDDIKPPLQSVNECASISAELSLYTPPETPAEAIAKDFSIDALFFDNNVAINSINHIPNIVNEGQSTNIVGSSNHGTYCSRSSTQIDANSQSENISANEKDNLCITNAQELNNVENILKDIFIETNNIELKENITVLEDNACIDKKNLEIDKSKAQLAVKNEDIPLIKNTDNKNQDDAKISDLSKESGNLTEKNTISKIKIRTIEIDGLPPVSLSYQVPTSLLPTTTPNERINPSTTQSINISQSINTNLSTTPSNGTHKVLTMINKQPSGQNVYPGKRYAKFHFSAIKKKTQTTNNNDNLTLNNKCLLVSNKSSSNNKGTDQSQKQESSKAVTPDSCINMNEPVKVEIVKPESTASENGNKDSNLNIDSLLDDFIKEESLCGKVNESYILPDIDEDWINSLLH